MTALYEHDHVEYNEQEISHRWLVELSNYQERPGVENVKRITDEVEV